MNAGLERWWLAWDWEPSVVAGIGILVCGYLLLTGPFRSRFTTSQPARPAQVAWFISGALVLFLALVSPLDFLGDHYLFSAHMAQHVLIALVAPPLLLLGTPQWLLRPLLCFPPVRFAAVTLTRPLVAFALFNGVFLAWHLPSLYQAALQDETIHIFEHLLFIATGILNWWPVLSPLPELPRLSPPAKILYIFLEETPTAILSALLVFASVSFYTAYAAAPRVFDLSPLADQQIAGFIMWVPGQLIYLAALSVVFFTWIRDRERAESGQRSY